MKTTDEVTYRGRDPHVRNSDDRDVMDADNRSDLDTNDLRYLGDLDEYKKPVLDRRRRATGRKTSFSFGLTARGRENFDRLFGKKKGRRFHLAVGSRQPEKAGC